MGIAAGELRYRVTIEQYGGGGRDEDGFEIASTWSEYAKVWAKITPLSSKDLINAQAAQSEVIARMVVRHRTDITTDMRVVHRGRIYHIASEGLDDNENGLIYTTFQLSSGVERSRGE